MCAPAPALVCVPRSCAMLSAFAAASSLTAAAAGGPGARSVMRTSENVSLFHSHDQLTFWRLLLPPPACCAPAAAPPPFSSGLHSTADFRVHS
jgi:hypothetical protein